jgi:hypothetical protein
MTDSPKQHMPRLKRPDWPNEDFLNKVCFCISSTVVQVVKELPGKTRDAVPPGLQSGGGRTWTRTRGLVLIRDAL